MHWYVMTCRDVFQSKFWKKNNIHKTNMKTKLKWNWTKFESQSVPQLDEMVRPAAWWSFESDPVVPIWPPAHLSSRWPVRKGGTSCLNSLNKLTNFQFFSSCLDHSSWEYLSILSETLTNKRFRPRPFPGWVNQRTCLTHLECQAKCLQRITARHHGIFGKRFTFLSSSRVMRSKNRE